MQRIIFESSPYLIVVCFVAALGYATLLYFRTRYSWSPNLNYILFALRAALTFFLAFLLLGPIVKQINNLFEKPVYVVVQDNSASITETTDSLTLGRIEAQLAETNGALENAGYSVNRTDLNGNDVNAFQFPFPTSDLQGALKKISSLYEGRNVAGVILLSDGIYNTGFSPLFASYNFPVYTIGVGDTVQRADLAIKNIAYNKIAYQGNKFPVRAEVLAKNLENKLITVSLFQRGKLLDRQTKNTGREQLIVFDFNALAGEQGIQKMDVQIEVISGERNTRNNRSSFFVEVVEGKKKILLVAPAPHPDIKAIREVIGKNSNYEFFLHIPGLTEQQPASLQPSKIDLAIFHQAPDIKGKTRSLFQQFAGSKTSVFLILGQQADLREIVRLKMPLTMEAPPRDYDEVTPIINPGFSSFTVSPETNSIITDYPPASVHFGKIQVPLRATPLLFQRIGSIATTKPLLAVDVQDSRKTAILLGEGIWRWRLNEFDRTENTAAFDELFGKLFQYLSTSDDKRKFRSYPVQQEFSETEPVIFESQIYNDIFEPVYGNTIQLELIHERGKKSEFTYVTSPGNIRYQIGGLTEGVYRYKAKTKVNEKVEEIRGEFALTESQAELQNLTADFELLRKLSANTGGKFYTVSQIQQLQQDLAKTKAKSIIHSEETYSALINLKWIFILLLALVSTEWFLRKFFGSY
ncbi:MAG: hypothetical protein JNM57_16160 [Cyclobacteriaceae bacterium]|nr:hypothetical protein [Cyclobacteriaceae bacterium]